MRYIAVIFAILVFCVPVIMAQDATPQYVPVEELAAPNGDFSLVNGARIYYESNGNPSDPAVILIHGFGGSAFAWRHLGPALADAGYYAIAVDLPPFGLSDKNPDLPYTQSWLADSVAGLMDNLNITSATIIGHSMGGAVTAQFAVRHPEKVDQLVFVAGGIFEVMFNRDSSDDENNSTNPLALLNTIDPESPTATFLIRRLVDRDYFVNSLTNAAYRDEAITDEVVDGYATLIQVEDAPTGFLAYVQAQETEPVTIDDLTQVVGDKPVLILWGEEDQWVPLIVGEAIAEAIPQAQFVIMPEVGHLPMDEAPDEFNAHIIAFIG